MKILANTKKYNKKSFSEKRVLVKLIPSTVHLKEYNYVHINV